MKGFYNDVVKQLKTHGYRYLDNAKGSHENWVAGKKIVRVPFNLQSKFTANAIMKQAGIDHKF